LEGEGGEGMMLNAHILATAYAPLRHYDDLWICNNMGVYKNGNTRFMEELNAVEGRKEKSIAKKKGNFDVFPNPATELINIQYLGEPDMNQATFKLYDLTGKLILTDQFGVGHAIISIPPMATGVYTYTISNGSNVLQRDKLLIEK
jgi:hypothetical protein